MPLDRPSTDNTICNSCLLALHRRYATASAVAASIPDSIPIAQHTPPVTTATAPHQSYQIQAGIVVSRPPLLTRDLHPFEKAYYFYQRRLNERLALPFTRYFYYQKDTPADTDWKKKIKARLTPARDIGIYNAYGKEGWADELLVGAKESEPSEQVEALLKDAQVETDEDSGSAKKDKVEKPMPRTTEADRDGDTRSLNRALSRTLYLVVQGANGGWGFPCGELAKKETLHTVCGEHQAKPFISRDWLTCSIGSGETTSPVGRNQHEHVDRRQSPCRTLQPQIRTTTIRAGDQDRATRGEDILHESQDNGWPGEPEGQQAGTAGFQMVSKGRTGKGGPAAVLETY